MAEENRGRYGIVAGVVIVVVAVALATWFWPGGPNASLIAAAKAGDVSRVAAALDAGAAVDTRDADGITPLMLAARGNRPVINDPAPTDRPEAVEVLLNRGADVNAKTEDGFVALFWAARYGHVRIAKVLIDHGANVNAKDKQGLTALKWATTNNQAPVIALLKDAGAKE